MRADAIELTENRKRGMILPFEPHSLTFDDVKYSVDMPAVGSIVKRKEIELFLTRRSRADGKKIPLQFAGNESSRSHRR